MGRDEAGDDCVLRCFGGGGGRLPAGITLRLLGASEGPFWSPGGFSRGEGWPCVGGDGACVASSIGVSVPVRVAGVPASGSDSSDSFPESCPLPLAMRLASESAKRFAEGEPGVGDGAGGGAKRLLGGGGGFAPGGFAPGGFAREPGAL